MLSLKRWLLNRIEGDLDAKAAYAKSFRGAEDEERELMVRETLDGKRGRWRVRANSLRVEARGLRQLGDGRRAELLEEEARELEELLGSDSAVEDWASWMQLDPPGEAGEAGE